MIKYYYIKHNESNIGIGYCSIDLIPSNAIEIVKEQYDISFNGLQNNQLIYLDKNNKPQLRDKFTKWDESTKTWIPDEDAIAKQKLDDLINQAHQALNTTAKYDSPSYRIRLSDEQNKANDIYRSQLYDILEDKYNGTELPINPNKKE